MTGYYLTIDRACRAFECHPSPASGCKTCRAQEHRTAKGQCSACNEGYFLDDDACHVLQKHLLSSLQHQDSQESKKMEL